MRVRESYWNQTVPPSVHSPLSPSVIRVGITTRNNSIGESRNLNSCESSYFSTGCLNNSLLVCWLWGLLGVLLLFTTVQSAAGQTTASDATPSPQAETPETATSEANGNEKQQSAPPPKLPPPADAKPLTEDGTAWFDRKNNAVVVAGHISLRNGLLEMFACPRNTKEHESIVAVESEALPLHAGLLLAGAEPGGPVAWVPEYKPPRGTKIEVHVQWIDEDGNRQLARAQDWVRDARTKKAMALPWVFAGSGFWRNEQTGQQGYLAEQGDLICVVNFSTAMLDVPVEISNANEGLFFEAFTERIPPLGWPVQLVLKPVLEGADGEKLSGGTAREEAKPARDAEAKPAAASEPQ